MATSAFEGARGEKDIRMSIRHAFKKVLAFILYVTGVTGLFFRLRFRRKNRILVLLYHEIRKPENRFEAAVSLEHFEEQIRFIKKHFEVISLTRMLEILSTKKAPEKPLAVVTFDDGYRDNLTVGCPVLRKYSVPAAIFLSVESIGNREPMWTSCVEFLFKHTKQESVTLGAEGGNRTFRLGRTDEQRMNVCYQVKLAMKQLPDAMRQKVLNDLKEKLRVNVADGLWAGTAMLSWDDVRTLAKDPLIEIGSHALSHRMLANLPPDEMQSELKESKKKIEDEIGKEVSWISYPGNSYDRMVQDCARKAGYKAGFAVNQSLTDLTDDLFELKRVHIEDGPAYVFLADISLAMKFFYSWFGKK